MAESTSRAAASSVERPVLPVRSLLIVLRGPSGSGKSTTATALRARYGRGLAIVRQDAVRREILRERDMAGGVNVGLIDAMTRHILGQGLPCVLEGILYSEHYGAMLDALMADTAGADAHAHANTGTGTGAHSYYFDIPFDTTVERHYTKPNHGDFTVEDMRDWYADHDVLPGGTDRIIGTDSSRDATVDRILAETGLLAVERPDLPSFSD